MFVRYLPVVFLLSAVSKGMTTTDPLTQNVTTTPTTSHMAVTASSNSSSNYSTSSFPTSPPSLNTTFTENNNVTISSPTESPSAPTTGSPLSTASPETSQPNTTITGHTTLTPSTETAHVTTLASSTTIPTSNTTIPTGTTITGTTLRPTDITTKNTTTTPAPITTSTTGSTITTGTTPRPTDITTKSTTTTLAPVTTTTTGTTLRPTETTTTISTTAAPSIPPPIVCPAIPCPLESVCLNGTCQCIAGSFLVDGRCERAQVFPGQLHIISREFQNEMSNRSSQIFKETAAQISAALREALKNEPGYRQSDVVQLQPGSVRATVNNIFENTNATQASVDQAINMAIANSANNLFKNATFTATSLCAQEPFPCDVSTTVCTDIKGRAVCSCKEGYISILYSNTSCKACPSGQRAVGDTCQQCAFGYAGFNCNDSALLAVVVISCVLGGILLIIVLALLIYCCWRGCPRSKQDYSSSPYSSGDPSQPWPTGITPIPRASTNWEAATPIEMTEGGSTHVLVDKKHQTNGSSGSYDLNPEGMNTFKGKNPSRYSYLVQGHENPYFLPGDDKKN